MEKKKIYSSTGFVLIGLIAGVVVGMIMPEFLSEPFSVITSIYMSALQMMIYPLVFCSIVLGIVGIGNISKTGKVALYTILLFTATTALAALIGLVVPRFLHLGEGVEITAQEYEIEPAQMGSIIDTIKTLIPSNPLKAFVDGNMLQVLVFAVIFGFACIAIKEKADPVVKVIQSLNDIAIAIVTFIMKFIPLGIFFSIANVIHTNGPSIILQLGYILIAIYIVFALYAIVVYGGLVKFGGHMSPLTFFKGSAPAALNAFATCSSSATLPLSLECADKNLHIPNEISSLSLPLGATINMDAVSIAMSFMITFFATALNIPISFGTMAALLAANVLLSIGTPGIPNGAIASFAALAPMAGLPVNEIIAMYASVNALIDMGATCVNVLGDLACSVVVKRILHYDTKEEKTVID